MKDFNTFIYDHTLHRGRKYFCRHCLQGFSTEEILKRQIKDCFKINDKQRVINPKKGEYGKSKNYEKSNFLYFMQILKVFYCQTTMESIIQKSLIQTNIKDILLAVMAIN